MNVQYERRYSIMKVILWIVVIMAGIIAFNMFQDAAKDTSEEVGSAAIKTINNIEYAKQMATGVDEHHIQTQIVLYITTYNTNPKSLQEMVDKGMLKANNIVDPWNRPYQEKWTANELILNSKGQDGVGNTPDDQELRIHIGG
jgi:hypothetical protein